MFKNEVKTKVICITVITIIFMVTQCERHAIDATGAKTVCPSTVTK